MKNDEVTRTIVISAIIIIIGIIFLYTNALGIDIGYKMSGGEETVDEEIKEEELIRDYEKYKSEYELYKDSSNFTMQKWAKNAVQKANDIADRYNTLNESNKLEK